MHLIVYIPDCHRLAVSNATDVMQRRMALHVLALHVRVCDTVLTVGMVNIFIVDALCRINYSSQVIQTRVVLELLYFI